MTAPQESALLIDVARPLGAFIARLFQVEPARQAQLDVAAREAAIFRMKHFIVRRACKRYPEDKLPTDEPADLRTAVAELCATFPDLVVDGDEELTLAAVIDALLAKEKAGAAQPEMDLLERWAAVHRFVPAAAKVVAGWVSFRHAHAVDFEDLVPLRRPEPKLTNITEGPPEHRRRRDGFGLTDGRMSRREVASESDYCMYCHEREKDSCSKGMHDKTGVVKKNPIGVSLRGCPLNEKIGEMHVLRRDGDSIAALAMVVVDNPMVPGTGHRICNDCMKACIFQKQEPVNIPQAETGVLTDVLGMRWGYEIYGLLTRWNPLNRARPVARPYIGKNVLVVGMGPAGSTLSQHLLNAGFGVVGIDGLKIEPLPADLIGADVWPPRARGALGGAGRAARRAASVGFRRRRRVRHHRPLGQELPDRAAPEPGAAADLPRVWRHPLRRHGRRRRGVRDGIRSRGDRGGRRQADDHQRQEQPDPRRAQGVRLPDGAAALGGVQARLAGQSPGAGCRPS